MESESCHTELTSALEDYLEAILGLVRKGHVARVRDIAKQLHVGMPSVTSALHALAKRKLVNYDPYQVITLTPLGEQVAQEISGRHNVIRKFLTDVLGLDGDSAEANACRMEHAIDQEAMERLRLFAAYIQTRPQMVGEWFDPVQVDRDQGVLPLTDLDARSEDPSDDSRSTAESKE